MSIEELESKIEDEIRNIITNLRYVRTGRLRDSVQVICTFDDGGIDIQLIAEDYIYYVGDGVIIEEIDDSVVIAGYIEDFLSDYYEEYLN